VKHIRTFLGLEAVGFAVTALVHAGAIGDRYQHREATIAEAVIAGVLGVGLLASLVAPASSRPIALGVQGFALLGTLVGIFTIVIGIGPQSPFDLALHAGFVALLVAGLTVVARGAGRISTRGA
jgi:hypothetical protein